MISRPDKSRIVITVFGWSSEEFISIIDDNAIYQQPLYPNPAKDYIMIENGEDGERFELINLEGVLVKSFVVESYPYHLDTLELPRGTYFLKNTTGTIIHKFIKE